MPAKILLAEDDESISDMVKNYLTKDGFAVTTVFNGEEAIERFWKETFDLVIIDIMMPKLDGVEVMKIIRSKSAVPILIMSAKDSDVDKAVGLGLGADDYISKPFSMIEFSARVKAAVRRATVYSANEKEKKVINVNRLVINLENMTVEKEGKIISLTSKEFDILKLFVANPGRVFTKAQIYSFVWNDDYFGDENVINVHMRRLREKIEDNPSNPQYIKTLWGMGYKLGDF